MALGVPIISTHVGGNPELITNGEDGFLISPNQKDEWLSTIKLVLDKPERSLVMAAQAKLKSQNFSVENMVNGLVKIFKNQ